MANPDQSDFLANRIRYVQNQPHLQQPPAPETHKDHQTPWFIRPQNHQGNQVYRATQVHQAQQVQHHQHGEGEDSPDPQFHQAQGPPDHQGSPFSNNQGRECKSNGMMEACNASTPAAAGCRYGKLMREHFLSDTREVVMGEGILQLPTWWHGGLVTTSTSWPALPPPLPHYPADLVRRAERALLLPANNPTTTPPPNPELDTS